MSKQIWLAPILSDNRDQLLERAAEVLATGPAEGLLYLAASRPLLDLTGGRLLDGVRCRGVWNTLPVFLFRGLVRHIIATAIDDETALPLAPRIPIDRDELPLKRSLISQVMLRLLGEGKLKALEPLAHREGCVNSIAKLIGEIQRAARTPAEFASVVEARARDFYHTPVDPEVLSTVPRQIDFDREIALIYSAYQAALDRFHLSEDDADQLRALGVLRGELNGMPVSAPWLSGVRLLVLDGFFDFTPAQGEMLRLLIPPVADVIINLGRDELNPEIFRPFSSTIEQLNSIAEFTTIITTRALPVAASLAPLREHLFNPSARAVHSTPATAVSDDGEYGPNITFLECSNRQTEIRAIAKRIKRLVLVEGFALADIALVVRELASYSETITRVFDEESIPSSLDHRIQLSEVSSVRAAMKLFDLLMELAREGEQLRVSALADVVKSGYFRLSESDLDALRREDGRRTTDDGRDWEDGRRSSVAGQRTTDDGRDWDADELENVIAYVGSELRTDRWLKRARQLTSRSPERDTDATDEESESEDENTAGFTEQPNLQNRRVQQAEPVDVPLPGSDRRPKPAREIHPGLIAWSALVVERFAQIITTAPREASPRELRDWVMRTLDQLQFASAVKGTDQSIVEESDIPRLTLDLRGLEGLRLAFATAVRSIESSERVVNEAEAPSAIKLSTLLEEAMRCVRAQSLATGGANPDGLKVLEATDIRGLRFRALFVAGLVEGGCPLRPARDWIYPHEERERLKHYGLTLEDISPDTLLKEEHYFYQAACRATEKLFLSRPLVLEDGSETAASYYIEELSRAIAPGRLKKETVRNDFDGRTLFDSTRGSELATLLVRQQERRRHRAQREGNYPAEVIERLLSTARARGYLSESIERRIAIERERGSQRFGNFDGVIVDSRLIETLRERYGADHFFSASELSLYGKCPFKFFAEKVLKLEPRGEAALDLTALDAGSLLHEALRRFFELHRGERLTGYDRIGLRRQLGEVADAVFDEHQRAVPPLNARVWEIDREIRKLLLEQVLDYELSIQEQTASIGVRPAYFELAFGMPGGEVDRESSERLLELRRASGDKSDTVRVRGQIDRVDMAADGTAIAYDYKLSRGASLEDMQEGRALQLHIYLSALEQLFLPGRPIAGGGYYTMKGGHARRNQGLYRAALEVYTKINRRTASMLTDSEWKRIRDEMQTRIWEFIDGMRAGQFRVEPSAPDSSCPHCDYSAVCRYEKFRIQRKDRGRPDGNGDDRLPAGEEPPDGRSAVVGHPSSDDRPSFRALKPEQQQAASTLDRHVAVTAGPGAGKTTVLVERYLNILRTNPISVDQIVAITFTNRAANEMRERLRREMDKLLQEAEPRERARWMHHKRTLDGAIITTIHGFCARLLREFPLEAGVDPQFALLDAHQSAMLEEATVEEALTEFISAGHQATTELAAGIGRAKLVRGLIDIYRSMRNQGLTIDQLSVKSEQNHKTIEEYRQAVDELADKMRDFIRTRDLSPAAEARRSEATLRWPALCEYLLSASDSTPVTDMREAIQEFREAARPNAQGAIGELVESLDELIWKTDLRGLVPQCLIDLSATKYAQELIKLVGRIERDLNEEKRRRGALDFDDLQARALKMLEEHPEVLRRTSSRYRFFLVDEFQDTNALQRDLLIRLAFGGADFSLPAGQAAGGKVRHSPSPEGPGRLKSTLHANLFIVGDRKQSIYGFRGADVDVFREMTERIQSRNGLPVSLNRNFRSQRPLITFFNVLFERVFAQNGSASADELNELGYVAHEASIAARKDEDATPVVELLIDLRPNNKADDRRSQQSPRERDADQLAARIGSLVGDDLVSRGEKSEKRPLEYRDIALLFRAMTEVHLYEAAFRRAGIPYVTVEGRGFYAREEITDFIQLLRFLDNKTDEVALAALLRSPICGLSDDTLLALRCAPARIEGREPSNKRGGVRPLLDAVRNHELIEMIDEAERPALDRARLFLNEMICRAKRARISELLRFAVEGCEYRTIAAANFDGAGRLANIEKLFTLAERFERAGAHLIRDFVRYVRDFEEAGGRESEGQIDEAADAVRLMSIHQSKGLEFPVVIIPDLHRQPDNRRDWWALDRHRGLTLKVPDGRGKLAAGCAYTTFAERAKRREQFESMRLLYVAATRAKDRLILSGAAKDLASLRGSWLEWLTNALEVGNEPRSGTLRPREEIEVRLTLNLLDSFAEWSSGYEEGSATGAREKTLPAGGEGFPLLASIEPQRSTGLHRFSVTQLLNHERCPRQYYFDRVLHAPGEEEIAVWNDAEAPEPPANLTATLRGAVIHRFCEKFREGDDLHDCLKSSFEGMLRQRAAELGERVLEVDPEKAVHELLPLARNYVGSKVRQRIEAARAVTQNSALTTQHSPLGVFSEQRFRLRRPLGILSGTIDKMLVIPAGEGFNVEIIDFKTNRFRGRRLDSTADGADRLDRGRRSARDKKQVLDQAQMNLGFVELDSDSTDRDLLIQAEVEAGAADYRVQMQAYALAVRELMPGVASVRVTLHFLDPDVEVSLSDELLDRDVCAKAIDRTMLSLVSSSAPESFPPLPADHCRMCKFVELCLPGRRWLTEAMT